jgi:predicted GH43/DUF377 family glycosyl hydrolase
MTAPATTQSAPPVSTETMRAIYDEVKTPHKFGIVLRGEGGRIIDCPSVFRRDGKWWMMYVCMNEVGYETHLAVSDDLLKWNPVGKILSFNGGENGGDTWDKWQADGGISLADHHWGGTSELQEYDGKYWMSYIGGALEGYEPDPLSIGIAWTKDPTMPVEWNRIAQNPVLGPAQPDARAFEKKTLYKSNIIWDKSETLGHPFVMYYNGKQEGPGIERIGMAVSQDMIHWSRFGDGPVIDNIKGISGDPQLVLTKDPAGRAIWVMFYFGHVWKPAAFDTFACSYDMVNWTKWDGPHLTEPSEPFDHKFAHKPWVLKHDGVVYHFYCAVGSENRVIALATSEDVGWAG